MSNVFADAEKVREMADLMRLLGDPTRIRVLGLLRPGEMNVSQLCRHLDLAQPTVSHHLGLLRTAGLVTTRRSGKQVYYALNPDQLAVDKASRIELSNEHVRMRLGDGGAWATNGHSNGLKAGADH